MFRPVLMDSIIPYYKTDYKTIDSKISIVYCFSVI